MPSIHNKKIRFLFSVSLLSISLMLIGMQFGLMNSVFGSQRDNNKNLSDIDIALQQINYDLSNIQQIIFAQPKQIVFIDKDNTINKYSYEYNTIWKNGNPVVTDVYSFNFEYRTKTGNLIITAQKQLSRVASVAYITSFYKNQKELFKDSKIELAFNN